MSASTPIYVDDREKERPNPRDSSRVSGTDMLTLIRSHRTHPTAFSKHLLAGDFCFTGEGPDGPCLIGIERKTVKGLLSDIRSGRFSGEQLPKLLSNYEFVFLIVEGRYRSNWKTGLLEEGRLLGTRYNDGIYRQKEKEYIQYVPLVLGTQTFVALELEAFTNTLSMCTPIREIKHTNDEYDTAEYVLSLHHSFSKPWDKHSAHVAIHRPEDHVLVGKTSTVRRVSHALTGIGWEKSSTIDKAFNSVADMCEASPKDYENLPGFGKKLSKQVWAELHGQFENGRLE